MEVTVTVKKAYKVTFSVEEYINTEGGMDENHYGPEVSTVEESIVILEEAIALRKGEYHNWQIIAHVGGQL
jgi:hypothetical protein